MQLEVGLLLVLVVGQKAVGLERQEGGGHVRMNSDARPRSQSERMWAMKSSVTSASASSVTSSRLRAMRLSSRSKGPSNWGSVTLNPGSRGGPCSSGSGDIAAGDDLAGQPAVGIRTGVGGRVAGDRLIGHGGVRELDRAPDASVEELLTEGLLQALEHLP